MSTTYTRQHAVDYDNNGFTRPYVASSRCSCHPGRHSLHVVYANGRAIDWPVKLSDGRILYDWPERVPKGAKRLVERAFAAQA